MRKRLISGLFILCTLLAGCSGRRPPQKSVVCEISVTVGDETKTFTSQSEMIPILEAIRNRGQLTTPQIDPDTLSAEVCRIVLHRTDKTTVSYELKGDRYIRRNAERWQAMDPHVYAEMTRFMGQLVTPAQDHDRRRTAACTAACTG